jgi:hypothetical protein
MKYKYTTRPILQHMYALFPIPNDARGLEENVVSSYGNLIKVRSVQPETHDNVVLLKNSSLFCRIYVRTCYASDNMVQANKSGTRFDCTIRSLLLMITKEYRERKEGKIAGLL